MNKAFKIIFVLLAVVVGSLALSYLFFEVKFGLRTAVPIVTSIIFLWLIVFRNQSQDSWVVTNNERQSANVAMWVLVGSILVKSFLFLVVGDVFKTRNALMLIGVLDSMLYSLVWLSYFYVIWRFTSGENKYDWRIIFCGCLCIIRMIVFGFYPVITDQNTWIIFADTSSSLMFFSVFINHFARLGYSGRVSKLALFTGAFFIIRYLLYIKAIALRLSLQKEFSEIDDLAQSAFLSGSKFFNLVATVLSLVLLFSLGRMHANENVLPAGQEDSI